MKRTAQTGSVFFVAALASACGGGGGGVNSAQPGVVTSKSVTSAATAPQPDPNSQEMRHFNASAGSVNGAYIFTSGWQGQGVTVGVMDDGAFATSDLRGQIDTENSKDFGFNYAADVPRGVLGDDYSDHGTQVATIIAGKQDGNGTTGFAPKAKIAVLRITDTSDTIKEQLSGEHGIEAFDYAGTRGIKVINRSLAGNAHWAVSAAMDRYSSTGGLLVNSAGNDAGAEPKEAGNLTDANRNSVIFVGAVTSGRTPELEKYSTKAGIVADRYVVAPGTNMVSGIGDDVNTFSGTSSAAPVVTALAADILSKWPQLTGQQAGEIILATTKDLGAPGTDPIYGRGLVDFQAALSPVNPTLSNGIVQTSVRDAVMVLPDGIDSQPIQTALADVTLLDGYGRDYQASLAGLIVKPNGRDSQWLRRRIANLSGDGFAAINSGTLSGRFSYARGPISQDGTRRSVMTGGKLDFQAGRTGFHVGFNGDGAMQGDFLGLGPISNAVLAYAPQIDANAGFSRDVSIGRVDVTYSTGASNGAVANAFSASLRRGTTQIQFSLIDENGAVLGARSSGVLKLGRGARTGVIEAHHRLSFGQWNLEGYASVSETRLKIDSASLVTSATPLIGTRFGLQATRPALGGALSLGLAQLPMTESGSAHLTFGSGYDLTVKKLGLRNIDVPLSGERRFALTAGYALLASSSDLRFGVTYDVRDASTKALINIHTKLP